MSIANKILDSKYLGHYLDRTPDGRTRISRRWEITADKTNPAELEAMLFQAYGTADGVDGSRYAFTPNSEKVFGDAYLVEQYVRSQGRGVSPTLYTLTKVYEQADDTLRLLASPTFRTDENGRRYGSSRHVVLTSAWEAEESELPGTVGETTLPAGEGEESAFVLNAEESASEGFVLTVVTREWVEVTEEAAQVGKIGRFRGPDGILRYSQRLVQLASAEEELGKIGEDTLGETKAKLFTQRSESTEVVRTITKEFVEPGIVSQSTDFRNNGKLELRTVRSFVDPVETPEGFTLTSTSTENPEGYPITTYNFAKGEGRVSTEITTRNNGKLTISRIRFLGADDQPKPPGVLTSSDTEERDGHTLTTESYAAGNGRVSTDEDRRSSKLTVTTIRFLGADSETKPAGVRISTDTREEDGYIQTTERYADGSGRIEWRISRRENQLVLDHTIRYLGTDDGDPISGILIDESESEEAGYVLYSKTYRTATNGEIGRTVRKRNNGKITITTVRSVGEKIAAPGVEIESGEEKRDGFTIYTSVGVTGSGRVSLRVETRHNGALTLSTVQYIDEDDGDPVSGALISTETDEQDGFVLTTKRYASGTGTIFDREQTRHNGALTIRTIRSIGTAPVKPEGFASIGTEVSEADGYKLYESVFASGAGQISSSAEERNGGVLTITTEIWLTAPDDEAGPEAITGEFDRAYREEDGYRLWTIRGASGTGEIGKSESEELDGAITYTTVRSIGPTRVAAANEFDFGHEKREGHTLWTSTGITINTADLDPLVEKRHGGKLTITTTRKINAKPAAIGAEISHRVREQRGYTLHEVVGVAGDGEIGRDVSFRQSADEGATGVTITRIRHLTALTADTDPTSLAGSVKIGEDKQDADGHRIWTVTYAKGTGTVSDETQLRNNGKLKIRTIRAINAEPETPEGFTPIGTDTQKADGYTIYSARFAQGDGLIQDDKERRNNGKLVLYTRQQLAPTATDPATPAATIGGTVVEIERRENEADGYVIVTKRWAEGHGVISRQIRPREQGLRTETVTFLDDEGLDPEGDPPAGIVLADDTVEENGVTRHIVSRMQSLSGGDPLDGVALTYETLARFVYPGRAKPIVTDQEFPIAGGGSVTKKSYDVFLSPPVETQVEATVEIKYQTSSELDIPAEEPLWRPTEGATINAVWLGWSEHPRSKVEGLRGYRAEGSKLEWTNAPSGWRYSVFGDRVYNASAGFVEVTGGPEKPDGNTYTLEAEIEPAFVGADGTVYYRQVRVYATIPAQEALPV